ncbi:hypothetical protein GPS55_16055 [Acinetobacter haemolyticus]|uniref:hypothetical protein n=1 Tax=Acinetobacter haemolyticus TaxID=29430 RepID=UPI001372F3E7|nr:hypothetical protein [Acinetobacter haemolyticus]NAR78058.1 hypothetical protein [Acinetobacter haemolyticus]
MKKKLLTLGFALFFSGCSTLDPIYLKRSSVGFKPDSHGSMSVWNSDLSAAIANKNGKICMQRAMTAKSFDQDTTINISNAILKIAQVLKPDTDNSVQGNQQLIEFQNKVKDTLAVLTTSTERTTFLDIGLFYTCQMAMNDDLNNEDAASVIKTLYETSFKVNPQNSSIIVVRPSEENSQKESVSTDIVKPTEQAISAPVPE